MDQRPTSYASEKAFKAAPDIENAILKDRELMVTFSPEVQATDPGLVERTVRIQFSRVEDEVKRILHAQIEQAYLDGIDAVEGRIQSSLNTHRAALNYNSENEYRKHLRAVQGATEYLKMCS